MGRIAVEFTEADLSAMRKREILVLPIFGSSLRNLWVDNNFFVSFSLNNKSLNQKALVGQIAIDPKKVLLPDSYNKVLPEHLDLIKTFSGELHDNWGVVHAMAIMPNAPTAVGAFFASLREGRQLGELEINYGSTSTELGWPISVVVGSYFGGQVGVNAWHRDHRRDNVWALPVVVPTR